MTHSRLKRVRLLLEIQRFYLAHFPHLCFVEGINSEIALVFGSDQFVLFHEPVDYRSSVPISGVRVTIVDDLVRYTVEAFSSPFSVEQIEVEAALVVESESIPCLDEVFVQTEFTVRVDEF